MQEEEREHGERGIERNRSGERGWKEKFNGITGIIIRTLYQNF